MEIASRRGINRVIAGVFSIRVLERSDPEDHEWRSRYHFWPPMKQVNAVVMPCLNEQQILAHSCASLGFGAGRTPPANSFLVIVDNDSSDGTREVAASIKAQSPPGCVIVVSEPEKGHVPARQRGTITAQMTARERGIARTNTLILQVDADTHYSENYVNEIANASAGTN